MSEVPLYRLINIQKSYASRTVLCFENLQICPGEIFALVGPSGAGKSTLLRLLNLLETPDQGKLFYKNIAVTPGKDFQLQDRRRVTMVFQRPMLLDRSVEENVRFGLELRGRVTAEDRRRISEILEQLGLATLARARARTLSGGEAQRVALARALAIQPEVLLLDEPTANLDPYNISLIEQAIADLNRQAGITMVLVTHNVFQARRLAQRVGLLLDGKIIEVSDAHTFFNSPNDPRTAAFVRGDMIY